MDKEKTGVGDQMTVLMRVAESLKDVDALHRALKVKFDDVSRLDVRVTIYIPSCDREKRLINTDRAFEFLVGFLVDRGAGATLIRGEGICRLGFAEHVVLATTSLERATYHRLLPELVDAMGWIANELDQDQGAIEVNGVLCLAGDPRFPF